MRSSQLHALQKVLVLAGCLGIVGVVALAGVPAGAAGSRCVDCHTDEEALIRSAAPAKAKKSALQSGAG
jgi:hypothetical protein